MSFLHAHKETLDAIKSWLSVITILCAAGYSAIEYLEHKEAQRVERSLSYVQDYRSGNIAKAKLALNQLLQSRQESLIQLLSTEQDPEVLKRLYTQKILSMTKQSEPQTQLEIAFSYFEEMAICIEKSLCDHDIIMSFFQNEVRSLFNAYYPYICSLRKQWNNPDVYIKTERQFINSQSNICR
ncbi:MAG: DUF4760 domain-containing protein [Gammaproteobacteria bacterium]|nr:DUF4760 domain-containing protein [Gammaproteobacteria bacterium]